MNCSANNCGGCTVRFYNKSGIEVKCRYCNCSIYYSGCELHPKMDCSYRVEHLYEVGNLFSGLITIHICKPGWLVRILSAIIVIQLLGQACTFTSGLVTFTHIICPADRFHPND